MARPCEDQASVLDAGDTEHAAGLENASDLSETVKRAVECFKQRVAKAGVEASVRKVEPVHAADPELDISDPVPGGVLLCVDERRLLPIDSVDVSNSFRKTQCDRRLPAADIENAKSFSRCGSRKSA